MNNIKLLDIGAANYTQDQRWCFQRHEIETVLFEPDERSYSALKAKGYEAYNYALGAKPGIRKLHLTRKPECSSASPSPLEERRFALPCCPWPATRWVRRIPLEFVAGEWFCSIGALHRRHLPNHRGSQELRL